MSIRRLYPEPRQPDAMQRVGQLASVLAALAVLGVVALVINSLPELRRYLKMEAM